MRCHLIGVLLLGILISTFAQETTSNAPRRYQHGASHNHRDRERIRTSATNRTGLSTLNGNAALEFREKDKYYEDLGSDNDEYYDDEYDNRNYTTGRYDEDEKEDKFIESGDSGIVLDHVDFVLLRLKHIANRVSDNITDILALQKKELKVNPIYKKAWDYAVQVFDTTKRAAIYNNTRKYSIVRQVPVEYHIALIAYTSEDPNLYREFNKDTREICSGNHVDDYKWKSYFKLLQLAVQTLGSQEARWMDRRKFLYRGASVKFNLKEDQILAFQHFISTSSELISAEDFAGASLFEFQGFYNGTAMAVWDHSLLEHEREVLFSPTQVFKVDSIHVGKHYTRYVLVKHELPPPCNKDSAAGTDDEIDARRLENALLRGAASSLHGNFAQLSVAFLLSALVFQLF